MKNIKITPVETHQVEEILPYVIEFRRDLFPTLDPTIVPKDLLNFMSNYIESQAGIFLQARDENNKIIGVIGMMPFDYRFPHLSVGKEKTVEVARLFVEPAYRRFGLGTQLFQELEKQAHQKNIHRLYLHTHPSLPGAYEFWLKQGFDLMMFCEESNFPTYHMQKEIGTIDLKNNISQNENIFHV